MKVLTLNLAGLQFDWFETRRKRLVVNLLPESFDIIFLQEVSVTIGERPYSQIHDLGRRLGLPFYFFSTYGNKRDHSGDEQSGIGVLSRWAFSSCHSYSLPPGQEEHEGERIAQVLGLCHPDHQMTLVNTHLAWRPEEKSFRLAQVQSLKKFLNLGLAEDTPVVIAGDFNTTPEDEAITEMRRHFFDAFQEKHGNASGVTLDPKNVYFKFKEEKPRRIDYVFCSQKIEVLKCEVILNDEESFSSDHFGVAAVLKMTEMKGDSYGANCTN